MLSMEQIQSFFPPRLRPFGRNILREYLQYKMLEAIFGHEPGRQLAFLGGTAIHIAHGNPRFSEDLDFDNRGLPMKAFGQLAVHVHRALSREGYEVELSMNARGHFRANLRFIGLLQSMRITEHREEKLLIHIDAEPQDFEYEPEQTVLNKFDVLCRINVVPIDILLSQKIACILQRPRAIGRDFYDAMFLWGKTGPNMAYLARKAAIVDETQLWSRLQSRCAEVRLEGLSRDLEPFVTNAAEARKVALFSDFVAARRGQ